MSVLVKAIVSGRHRHAIAFLLWMVITAVLLAGGFVFVRHQLRDSLAREVAADLARLHKVHVNVSSAFDALDGEATASPCSEEFLRQLRRIAFRPDGLNEFIYAPDGMVTCSTSITGGQLALPLGKPDITNGRDGISYWIDRRLDYVGLAGMSGIVAHREPFAVVIPFQALAASPALAAKKQVVLSSPTGRIWHVGGDRDLFGDTIGLQTDHSSMMIEHEMSCGADHDYCTAMERDVGTAARNWRTEIVIAIILIAFYATWPATALERWLFNYWSLDARFLRHLNVQSIVCVYQPIVDLDSGRISGCEVLARWRDVDGSIVTPDKFIDIVSRSGRTVEFTQMVADRAHADLSSQLTTSTRLQVNFNVFPRDLDSEVLRAVFSVFDADRDRFQLALEIVENDAISVETAEREIEALGRLGFRTYIDDFGSGYSSIHRLASLAIHGVKLDRSFAMAPSESLMARMLVHALDMVGSCGREVVVEGIETQERLDLLKTTKTRTFVQGYLISRPLPIERFVELLAAHDTASVLGSGRAKAAA